MSIIIGALPKSIKDTIEFDIGACFLVWMDFEASSYAENESQSKSDADFHWLE